MHAKEFEKWSMKLRQKFKSNLWRLRRHSMDLFVDSFVR